MDEMLTEQMEWLLSGNLQGTRLARCLLVLVGCLAQDGMPDNIKNQTASLTKQLNLFEVFDALIASLNNFSKSKVVLTSTEKQVSSLEGCTGSELSSMINQVEQTRIALAECDAVNYSEIVAWVMGQAKARKLWVKSRRR